MSAFHSRLFLRTIVRSREAYALKIVTLGVAFFCCTLIILFSSNEFGCDRFHDDYNSIFRVLQRNNNDAYSGNRLSSRIPFEIFSALQSGSGDSIVVSRLKVMNELSLFAEGQPFHNQKVHAADPLITDILSFEILDGSLEEFKINPQTILLSSSASKKYFRTDRAAGRKLKIHTRGDTLLFVVAAVYKDYPKNSHEEFTSLVRFDTTSIRALKFNPGDVGIYGKVFYKNGMHREAEKINKNGSSEMFYMFQPIADIYFGPRVLGEEARHGDRYSIIILISITILIFLLALTSFINLTTLTLPQRSKELAVKKLAGANQLKLLADFAKESFSIIGIALLLGASLLILMSKFIESALLIDLLSFLTEGKLFLILVLSGLSLTLGIAPLFLTLKFTGTNPTRLLSSEAISFPRFKRSIIFLQLGISLCLIVASLVIRRQVNYSLLKEPGRNHEQIVYIRYPKDLTTEGLATLRARWKKDNANIVDIMGTSQLPKQISSKELNSEYYVISVDPEFKDFFDLRMVEGNWFKANDGDSIIVVNESAKKLLGGNNRNVIGVVEDMSGQFNQPEKPLKINIAPHFSYNFLCVRILEVDVRKTIRFLADHFTEGTQKPAVSFLNKRFEQWLLYQDRLNGLSEILAIISGFLSCFAIYGLSVSIVRDKLKQIAIHKICGASTLNITRLLIKEFTVQLVMAVLIFGPITYIVLNELLRGFVYATDFSWTDPLLPVGYCVTIITVLCGLQALNLNRDDLSSALKAKT